MPERPSLLEVRSLSVHYLAPAGAAVEAVRNVSLDVHAGEAVGVLGESGSGKSTLALALMSLLPPNGRVRQGGARFKGRELLNLGEEALDRLRGDRISIVFQEPGLVLNPVLRVGAQIADVLKAHRPVSDASARTTVLELLGRVGMTDPDSIYRAYPHQLSGGQLQRIVIAQALVCRPSLLIADEPTAALDTVTQASLIELLVELRRELGMAVLFVSHDPHVLARLTDRLVVMYAGRIIERGPRDRLLAAPAHPYPRELLRCLPTGRPGEPLHAIPGAPPSLAPPPIGCAFEARCPDRLARCASETPPETSFAGGRAVACWNSSESPR